MRLEKSSPAAQREDAPGSGRKKSPRFGDVRTIAEAWAKARRDKLYRQVAAYLTRCAGDLEPRQLNTIIVDGIVAEWRRRLSRNTVHSYTCQLRSLLRTLEEHGAPKIHAMKVPAGKPREVIAQQKEIDAMVAASTPWLRLFILLCWQTALRFSEALAVTPRSYDRATNTAAIRTKGGKIRVIPMTQTIAELILPTLQAGDPDTSCIALLKGGRCSPGAIRSAWYKLTKGLELTHINPHDLRRTTATALYHASGHDIRSVQQYLGHDQMTSTLHYLAPLTTEKLGDLARLLNFKSEVKQ